MCKMRYAVIGHPIGHTMSPFIHRRLFALRGIDADYEALAISPQDFGSAIPMLRTLNGYNITLPYKQRILPYLDSLGKKASLYGSVNTVLNREGTFGFSTDAEGFLKALRFADIPLSGTAVILGCGGVARVMAFEAALSGCRVVLAARPQSLLRAAGLAGELCSRLPLASVSTCLFDRIPNKIDLLINATPVGMLPNEDVSPVPNSVIKASAAVFDAVYNPEETLLLKQARAFGAKTAGGIPMLVYQAAAAHTIWDGARYTEEEILALCEDTAEEMNRLFRKEALR